jgi:chitodextrinase
MLMSMLGSLLTKLAVKQGTVGEDMALRKQKLYYHYGWPTLESTTTRSVRVSASYLTYTTLSDIDRARHKSMLDYLYNAGYMKTYNEFREEAPELVRQ